MQICSVHFQSIPLRHFELARGQSFASLSLPKVRTSVLIKIRRNIAYY
jgi:hypothetical protein